MPLPTIPSGNVNSGLATGFEVANSCRFNDGDNPSLKKTPSGAGSLTNWTFSCWVKRSTVSNAQQMIAMALASSGNDTQINFSSGDQIEFFNRSGGSVNGMLLTNRVFRDVSSWYHIVAVWNSDDGTAGNRMRLYINGTEETSFATDTNPSADTASKFNSACEHVIGQATTGSADFDGYLAEVVYIDGQALTPTSFGEFDEDSPQIWKPIDVSGLTFGTNGFYLDFEDSSNLGNDIAGNGDWTEANLAATDQATDTPTNNFCTLNPLDQTNTGGTSATMAEGNLKWTSTGNASSQNHMRATFGITTGKWYWEAKMSNANSGLGFNIGVTGSDANMNQGGSGSMNDNDPNTLFKNSASTNSATKKDGSNVTTSLTTVAENEIVQIALDLDNQKFYVGVQGTWLNSANPATGSNPPATVDANTTYLPACSDNGYADAITLELNFGNPTFSISSGNADGNGFGNFEYSVPSGYFSLCSSNLAEFG